MRKRRLTKLRNLEIDRVDLVDRGANQYAEIVIAKRDVSDDSERERIKGELVRKSLHGMTDEQLKNGLRRGVPGFTTAQLMEEIRRRRKKKRKGKQPNKPPAADGQAKETMSPPLQF